MEELDVDEKVTLQYILYRAFHNVFRDYTHL